MMGGGGEEEVTPPRKLQSLNYQRVIGGTSRPARQGWWWSCSTLPNSNLKPTELKGKEKSWQEEPGEMEEQRWGKRGGPKNLDDPAEFFQDSLSLDSC